MQPKVNNFYALVDEDGDVSEIFSENFVIDDMMYLKESLERKYREKLKLVLLENFTAKEVKE